MYIVLSNEAAIASITIQNYTLFMKSNMNCVRNLSSMHAYKRTQSTYVLAKETAAQIATPAAAIVYSSAYCFLQHYLFT